MDTKEILCHNQQILELNQAINLMNIFRDSACKVSLKCQKFPRKTTI